MAWNHTSFMTQYVDFVEPLNAYFTEEELATFSPAILAAASIFAFLASWNEYQLASLMTKTPNAKTFLVGLYDFTSQFTVDWRGMCAMSALMMIPAITFVILTQRSMMRGLTFGAIKG